MGAIRHVGRSRLPVFHRALAAATVAGLAGLALSACGDRAQSPAAGRASSPAGAAGFDQILAAAQASQVAWCPLADGEAYVSLPAPPPESAAAASYFRYLEGRIYQFGPCGAGPGQDDELRIFRYAGPATRDAAIREISARNLRPTASFAVGDTFDAEIWSSDPSLEGPVGRAAAAVHGALGRMDGARHLEVDP